MLEIQQENNGKAIIVFTIVTIIFSPLSWATSYLGMNTSDIRDLQQGQWVFWLLALPVTAVVVGVAVLVLLKGESIREYFIRRQVARGKRTITAGVAPVGKKTSTWLTETSVIKMQPDPGSGQNIWTRFRRKAVSGRDGDV